jgi:2-hydroxy-3-oxopropionate reductase
VVHGTSGVSGVEQIAFLGIGLMGDPMARNLARAGHPVTAWNRTRAKADALGDDGVSIADDARSAVESADVVFLMLERGSVVEHVLFDLGVADAARKGTVVIDSSSIPPAAARDHARRLAERGVAHLDAPVSGGTAGAARAELAIMVGGPDDVYARVESVLARLGRPVRVGSSGCGQLAKLANQTIVGATIVAVAEALLLCREGGADPAAVRRALTGGFADSRILQEHGRRMLERDWVPGGPASMQLKDLLTVAEEAATEGLELGLARGALDVFQSLVDHGGADLDHSAALLELERRNGVGEDER